MAATWVRAWGWHDARVTTGGADGGLDIVGAAVAAQVKWKGGAAGRPDLQRLAGAARPGSQLIFFTASKYSKQAIEFADERGIALFSYDPVGTVTAENRDAEWLIQKDNPPPRFQIHGSTAMGRWINRITKSATGKTLDEWQAPLFEVDSYKRLWIGLVALWSKALEHHRVRQSAKPARSYPPLGQRIAWAIVAALAWFLAASAAFVLCAQVVGAFVGGEATVPEDLAGMSFAAAVLVILGGTTGFTGYLAWRKFLGR